MDIKNITILIPAYNPDDNLCKVVGGLVRLGFMDIIVVDDGSKVECKPVFEELQKVSQCRVVYHDVNLGKGRAIKTGLNEFYANSPESVGVVTADADGQHRAEDILKVAEALKKDSSHLVMGSRGLNKDVPFRSLFGNLLTRFVFAAVVGRRIGDTQSGLRGVPRWMVPELLHVAGERYEYEINMLIFTRSKRIDIHEVPIETIYIEDNRSSHFHPLFDSMKVYSQLLRFVFVSFRVALFDFLLFLLCFALTSHILASLFAARFIPSTLIYFNKSFWRSRNLFTKRFLVVEDKTNHKFWMRFLVYYAAITVMVFLSWLSMKLIMGRMGWGAAVTKGVVETFLFSLNYILHREFVFFGRKG